MLELSHLRLAQVADVPPDIDTVLLLVGRGSRDESATAEMYEFARLRQQQAGVPVEVAFLAMARPLLSEQLTHVAAARPGQVIVQPHLLFHGDLVDSLVEQFAEAKTRHGDIHWSLAPLLADELGIVGRGSELLETTILDRWNEAVIRVVAGLGDD